MPFFFGSRVFFLSLALFEWANTNIICIHQIFYYKSCIYTHFETMIINNNEYSFTSFYFIYFLNLKKNKKFAQYRIKRLISSLLSDESISFRQFLFCSFLWTLVSMDEYEDYCFVFQLLVSDVSLTNDRRIYAYS